MKKIDSNYCPLFGKKFYPRFYIFKWLWFFLVVFHEKYWCLVFFDKTTIRFLPVSTRSLGLKISCRFLKRIHANSFIANCSLRACVRRVFVKNLILDLFVIRDRNRSQRSRFFWLFFMKNCIFLHEKYWFSVGFERFESCLFFMRNLGPQLQFFFNWCMMIFFDFHDIFSRKFENWEVLQDKISLPTRVYNAIVCFS